MSYRKIADLIRLVDERNKDLSITHLVGLTINKKFIPSVANTIGTDMSNYKLIRKNQFACSTMQVRRDKKMPVALLKGIDEAIISQAYPVFEVIDEMVLLPEYLMMWFSRSEFDREACFHAVGGVRGSLEWEDFCNMELPIPSIEKQREIVAQYQAVENKIKVNEQICEKLEATAQALYKHWFVDFEFPIPLTPKGGTVPYKSSGGAMVFNEELEKEIPEGWEVKSLGEIASISAGGDKPKIFSDEIKDDCNIPIYSNSTDNYGLFGYTNKAKVNKPSITVSARGAIIGYTLLRKFPFVPIVRLITITPNDDEVIYYLFKLIEKFKYDDNGSAQGQLTVPDISIMKVLLPTKYIIKEYNKKYQEIELFRANHLNQNQKLTQLQSLLLSRLAMMEKN